MQHIDDTFITGMNPLWQVTEQGSGTVSRRPGKLWLTVNGTDADMYSNAQISDYDAHNPQFTFKPPLRLTVTGSTSEPAARLVGTAGFGFWNHPFSPGQRRLRLPRAVWFFFSSQHSDMPLALNGSPNGWKAATFDAANWQFLALLPFALPGFLLMRIPPLYRSLWSVGQRALGVSETVLDANMLTAAHTYRLDWLPDGKASFYVDDEHIFTTDRAPDGPLGFVAWIDNQFAVVKPQGVFRFGTTPIRDSQSLVLDHITIEPL